MTPSKPAKKAAASARKRKVTKTQRRTPLGSATPCVVGIGASAGGLDALHHFLQAMPSDSGLAFVVIPHLDPTRQSMASEVIGKWTRMPVSEARHNERIVANHIYTIPPNKCLAIKDGNLRLSVPKQRYGQRQAFDYFIDSFDTQQKDRVVGIVLSNTDSDSVDLKNILSSSDIATLCLDRQLRIKWFTPGMQLLFNLLPGDTGRAISDFSEALCGGGLIDDAKTVLKNRQPVTKEVQLANHHWYLRRLLPYRDEHNEVSGITATFTDITESKQQTEAILASQKTMAESLEQRVLERTQQLRELSMQLTLAEERERRALAQDLHDDLGQLLAVTKIKVTALEKVERVTELKQRIHEINTLLEQAHASVHSLTFQLSPPILEELGLIAALEWLGEEMLLQYDLEVKIMDDSKPKFLDTPVRTILFRAVRELLINVAKHADVARAIVTTRRVDSKIMIEVEDEGIGFEHQIHQPRKKPANGSSGGFGLLSVRERLIYIGGEMRVESIPGDGTRVTLLAPLSKKTRSKEPA